jgi:hypothetical protein
MQQQQNQMKTATIKSTRTFLSDRPDSSRDTTGTLPELMDYFSYTLEAGASWEHEKGNKKVNREPKTFKALVTALNNAKHNTGRMYQDTFFDLVQ